MLYRIYNGAVTLGNKTILEEIQFEVKNKEHVALVGRNGCGKTTLLRAIVGEIDLEDGLLEEPLSVTKLGNPKIGFMHQDAIQDDSITLLEEILKAYDDILKVENRLEKLSLKMEKEYQDKVFNEYQDLQFYYQSIGGYSYKREYETALRKFGFQEEDKMKSLHDFSFGQRTKISFLRLLLSKPDLLLLDEPTNHLDTVAMEWLESYLADYPKAIVVVSHDRMFIDKVCDVTYAIEYGSMKRYAGNYSYYLKQRENDYERDLADYERQQKEIERLTKIVERFRYKPTKASMALSKLKQVERMVKLDKPREFNSRTFSVNFNPRIDSYLNVLKVSNMEVGYDKVLNLIHFEIERGDRLGIIGGNGLGKSTFIKTLMGDIKPISGKYVFGKQVEIGYFDQNMELLDEEKTVLEEMENEFPLEVTENLRSALGAFEFYGDMVFQKISSLSGGQKVKLMLCKIMRHQPNVLILDEPTNHLDIIGKETIEKLLLQYKGTVIFVSHDRYFVQKVATKLLVFERGKSTFYNGNYAYYLSKQENLKEEEKISQKNIPDTESSRKQNYVSSFKERSKLERKLKRKEEEIQKLEELIKGYHQEMLKEDVYMNIEKVREVEEKLREAEEELVNKMEEWEKIEIVLEG